MPLSLQSFTGLNPLSPFAQNSSWLQRPVRYAASPAGELAPLVQSTSACKPRGLEKCSGTDTLTGTFPTHLVHERCRNQSLAATLQSRSPAVGFKPADLQCRRTAKPRGTSLVRRCASPSEAGAVRRRGNSKWCRSKRVVQAGATLATRSEEQEMEVVPRPPITVIATDVDGTLLDSKQQLKAETVAALKAAMARGIQVSWLFLFSLGSLLSQDQFAFNHRSIDVGQCVFPFSGPFAPKNVTVATKVTMVLMRSKGFAV
jgi:hypothetical protein